MRSRTNAVSTVLIVLLIATSVAANEKIAEYRHHSMEAVEVHFKSIRDILGGEVPFEDHLSKHVDALVGYADMMPDLFAEGSEGGEALDKIWDEEEQEKFSEAITAFKDAMQALKKVVDDDDSDAIPGAVRDVGNACRDCHRSYRE